MTIAKKTLTERRDDRSGDIGSEPAVHFPIKVLKYRRMDVDVVVMSSKLSHRPQLAGRKDGEPIRQRTTCATYARQGWPANRRYARLLLSSIVFSLVALGTACSDVRSASKPGIGDASEADPSVREVGRRDERFQWPVDADHPRLEIEVTYENGQGKIEVELMPELAPESVRRIVHLASAGHYDGTTFHRVIPGFMIQGGDPNSRDLDPTNDGRGGDPAPIPDEFSAVPFERGVVALANRGRPGSTSTQFFMMQADHRTLDGHYNAIGRVVRGLDLVDEIARAETDTVGRWGPKDRPIENVRISQITVARSSGPTPPVPSIEIGTKDE